MFRPDALARPRWVGNLKQYQIVYDRATDSLALGDSLGNPALNSATGFFHPSAISYWTTDSTFWINNPSGTPASVSDRPDGDIVEKGSVAQLLRSAYATSQATRPVFTCVGCPDGTTLSTSMSERLVDTNPAITSAMLGTSTATERAALINWLRGADNNDDELGPGGGTTVRPSVHGDVLHSRPGVVDYGGTIGTVVFYGSNDGLIHAIDGNRTGATAGRELWAFIPSEFFGRVKRLQANTPEIRFPTTPLGSGAVPRDYFADGSVTVYQKLDATKAIERVIIYVTMRRGGRFLYAFDVTQPGTPKLLWRKSNVQIPALGQTWSDPRVTLVRGHANPVLVMGAGYDAAAEDASPTGPTTMGNAIVVLDALDGSLVKALATDRSVPASVALMDSDFDGFTDRAYAADMGANVYRIDFETSNGASAPSSWAITKFATLNDSAGSRKFFFAPDIVQTRLFTAILIGSGNRERPLLMATSDRFYTLLDYYTAKGAPGAAPIPESALIPTDPAFGYSGTPAGCHLPLAGAGEKVVTGVVSTGGYSYFSTNQPTPPASNSCASNLGLAKTYRVELFCGQSASIDLAGGGLPPSPVIGYVSVQVPGPTPTDPPETRQIPFIIGGFSATLSSLAVSRVPINVDPTRRRTYWFTNKAR